MTIVNARGQERPATYQRNPESTVSDDLRNVSHSGHVQMPETITDSLGREQPASKPRLIAQPEPLSDVDLFAGEDWVQPDGPQDG